MCEFLGAFLLGANTTDTVKSKVADPTAFAAVPGQLCVFAVLPCTTVKVFFACSHPLTLCLLCAELLMYGMVCVLLAAAFWDNLSCQLEIQVRCILSAICLSEVTPAPHIRQ